MEEDKELENSPAIIEAEYTAESDTEQEADPLLLKEAKEDAIVESKTNIESCIKEGIRMFGEDTLMKLDILTKNLTDKNVKAIKQMARTMEAFDATFAALTKEEKFIKMGASIYLYTLAKYNSTSRALKLIQILTNEMYTKKDIAAYANKYPIVAAYIEKAKESFRDMLREEMYQRAVEGEDVPVFNKEGEQVDNIKKKDSKLFEAMVKANCEEYKDKGNIGGIVGNNITFQVVNFLQEE